MSTVTTEIGALVVDSGAFIKAAPLEKWSERVITVREVVEEIRDANTRRRLQVLPYELVFREPTQEALHHGETDALTRVINYKKVYSCVCMLQLHYSLEWFI